ncbi:MAG: hypothetical protein RBU45_23115 [Myxococcota bacterium]|nr:hypothetical protein [Myxococcota bacterium]
MVFLRGEVCLDTGNQPRKCKPANLEPIGPALFRSKDSAGGNATTERVATSSASSSFATSLS